ncbi:F0F1 ATP synthase subunit delta [Parabacteroides bouchesdurhonensis]|uniref:F0F1 ATP synthase subunit delta n=1 Tax=Parabacteroides bouchesdurhonensis TaxID=1936995 RepID=UPI000C848665|nr:F0F1 ATP synthase subunit delta [Parabacteroides bouchesdurhonensis]RHJ93504.1 F0F1 ATP synthase subunit delta [Bacteroides sp. AM07-16]
MDIGIISARYARALFAFAKDRGTETRVYNDIKMLATSFEKEAALKEVLDNPVLPETDKKRLIRSAAGIEVCPEFERFIQLVLQYKRESLLQIMCLIYISLYRKEKNINRIYLYTAVPLAKDLKDKLTNDIQQKTGGTIEFSEHINPELIGGLIIRMNNYQMDASVASQLKRVKKQLMEKNRQTEE